MHPDPETKSKSLLSITELTLVAPVRQGIVAAQDTRSYASRAALVLKTLNALRQSSKEIDLTPLIPDPVDEIRAIHTFRLTLLNPQLRPQVLLSVTFDGGWEPYMRQIWRDLGPLLDLIFCNCDDYPLSSDCSYDQYIAWVRSRQVSTDFFHTAGPMTVNDVHYLRRRERERIDSGAPAPGAASGGWGLTERFTQAMPGIAALYRLSDSFPPDLPCEGDVLKRAAAKLMGQAVLADLPKFKGRTPAESAALKWLQASAGPSSAGRSSCDPQLDISAVQGGILTPYHQVTHGCLLLLHMEDSKAFECFIRHVRHRLTTAGNQTEGTTRIFTNLAFTLAGLQAAGLPDSVLKQFPLEFREGMANRAGTLGDWRHNHPTHWQSPERWHHAAGGCAQDRVEMSTVHALLQLQISCPQNMKFREWDQDPDHPLHRTLRLVRRGLRRIGVQVLSVQSMQRLNPVTEPLARGHFDYADGISQPSLQASTPHGQYNDQVPSGDLLLGFRSSLDNRQPPTLTGALWTHSTFLVVRKLRQDVPAFREAVTSGGAPAELVKAHLMGRHPDGRHLIGGKVDNDFNYEADTAGRTCPFQSHVRRVNPRTPAGSRADQMHVPRILRRGMSYGPAYDNTNGDAERGLMFMAYNASIAEQFEVLQAWLAGGNSASRDSWSAQRDPFLAVPLDDEPRNVIFNDTRVRLDPARPWVRLQWGLYAFVPSLHALEEIRRHAEKASATDADAEQRRKDRQDARIAALAAKGASLIAQLQLFEQTQGAEAARTQWKLALEDLGARSAGVSQAIWTAIRQLRGGALRTPYGVLVADGQLVLETFAREAPDLTANGYLGRMQASFGSIYLGLDRGREYDQQSTITNAAIMDVSREAAFEHARQATVAKLACWNHQPDLTIEFKDLVEEVLADVSSRLFGLPDGQYIEPGGWHWEEAKARCPGHFNTPSRYLFQPRPSERVKAVGERHGQLLHRQAIAFVAAARRRQPVTEPICAAILKAFPTDDGLAARTLVGVMMGFLPTLDGNLRGLLYEWVLDRRLWDLQSKLIAVVGTGTVATLGQAETVLSQELVRTLQLRPVPEVTWRKAIGRHNLGPVEVQPGETVVIGIVSATQQKLLREEDSEDTLYPLFGGNRRESSSDRPTHACPGYDMAMGVLYGVLAGLMLGGSLQPTLSPLAVKASARC